MDVKSKTSSNLKLQTLANKLNNNQNTPKTQNVNEKSNKVGSLINKAQNNAAKTNKITSIFKKNNPTAVKNNVSSIPNLPNK